jgi:glycosyltransferase involved in cell wall biosynthesis
MHPDTSLILVTYNRARFLPRTLDCILNQTHQAFELLICDDHSTDATEQICRAYAQKDPRIRYHRNPSNLKMPGNLNTGLQRAACDLIAILHDGDIYHPETIAKWRQALLNNPTAAFVFNIYRHLNPDGLTGNLTTTYPTLIPGPDFLEKLCFTDRQMECPVWGTVMARRSALEQMNLLDTRYGFWADMDLYFRLAEKFDVAFVPEPLIDLPHRQVMPHLFNSTALTAHSTIFKIYWAARCRHFQNQPLRLTAALLQQILDFTITKTERAARRLPSLVKMLRWQQKSAPSAPSIARIPAP